MVGSRWYLTDPEIRERLADHARVDDEEIDKLFRHLDSGMGEYDLTYSFDSAGQISEDIYRRVWTGAAKPVEIP